MLPNPILTDREQAIIYRESLQKANEREADLRALLRQIYATIEDADSCPAAKVALVQGMLKEKLSEDGWL